MILSKRRVTLFCCKARPGDKDEGVLLLKAQIHNNTTTSETLRGGQLTHFRIAMVFFTLYPIRTADENMMS
jgi:hypothetical protein